MDGILKTQTKWHVFKLIYGRGGGEALTMPEYVNIDTAEEAQILFNYAMCFKKLNEVIVMIAPHTGEYPEKDTDEYKTLVALVQKHAVDIWKTE